MLICFRCFQHDTSSSYKTSLFCVCRRKGEVEASTVATEAVGGIKANGREATGLDWVLRGVRLPFIWPFQNMVTMKVTGKHLSLTAPSAKMPWHWSEIRSRLYNSCSEHPIISPDFVYNHQCLLPFSVAGLSTSLYLWSGFSTWLIWDVSIQPSP